MHTAAVGEVAAAGAVETCSRSAVAAGPSLASWGGPPPGSALPGRRGHSWAASWSRPSAPSCGSGGASSRTTGSGNSGLKQEGNVFI